MRLLYRLLLCLHPRDFRERFGEEMMSIFDASPERWRLIADALTSTGRQRYARPSFHPLTRWEAALLGVAMTSLSFFGFGLLVNDGVHRMNVSLRTRETHILDTLPGRRVATQLFRDFRPLAAIDANHDSVLSAAEMANAPARLLDLDRDHYGMLNAAECTRTRNIKLRIGRFAEIAAVADPMTAMLANPALAALDLDRDAALSPEEIRQAGASLFRLDADGDLELAPEELFSPAQFTLHGDALL
jgi:hypothetical protein